MSKKLAVWEAVEVFRARYGCLSHLPIPVLEVLELEMRIDLIPFPKLMRTYSVDAALKPDFTGIYVDEDSYAALEGKPAWIYNRLRFSLAHELGHIELHRDIAPEGGFSSLQEFWEWTRNTYDSDRYNLEWGANEFAGRLLVPVDRLKDDFDAFANQAEKEFPGWWESETLRESLCGRLGVKYQVCPKTIGARLDRENLWPSES